jgi:hypothetical protein
VFVCWLCTASWAEQTRESKEIILLLYSSILLQFTDGIFDENLQSTIGARSGITSAVCAYPRCYCWKSVYCSAILLPVLALCAQARSYNRMAIHVCARRRRRFQGEDHGRLGEEDQDHDMGHWYAFEPSLERAGMTFWCCALSGPGALSHTHQLVLSGGSRGDSW